jgi:uncharacterized phage-associated protein
MENKILGFELMIDKFHEWYDEFPNNKLKEANFTILKLIKLNFFVSGISCSPSEKGLLGLFDNYYAMPLGHVESDIYKQKDKLSNYRFSGHTILKAGGNIQDYDQLGEFKNEIINSIELLKSVNYNLINESANNLVEISHKWYSWKYTFNQAKKIGSKASKIDSSLIQNDLKYFSL